MNDLKPPNRLAKLLGCASVLLAFQHAPAAPAVTPDARSFQKPRVMVTNDGEIDDPCSMVRFPLYANEWDVERIVTSSSQDRWWQFWRGCAAVISRCDGISLNQAAGRAGNLLDVTDSKHGGAGSHPAGKMLS